MNGKDRVVGYLRLHVQIRRSFTNVALENCGLRRLSVCFQLVKGSSLASSSIGIKKKIRNLKLGDALSPRGPHRRSAASRTSTPRSTNAQGPAADATPTGSWRSKGTSTPRTSSPRHNRFGPGGIYRKAYTDNIGI
eukprot:1392216-Amorphochlora_amoeboformis.AAC.1